METYQVFKVESNKVPSPVNYSVIFPKSYNSFSKEYPLLLFLHGGPGDEKAIGFIEPIIRSMWKTNILPEMLIVTPSCTRSLYMNYKDGSEKWESFIVEEFLPYLKGKYRITKDIKRIFISGVSAGGLGALRIGFKNTDKFGAILAFEPAIEPVFEWKSIEIVDKFYRKNQMFERIFGMPVDEEYWKINNPAYILKKNAKKILNSGIKIYLEVGALDFLGLYRGAEFLHRILYENNIRHEFRIVFDGDHVGVSLNERYANGFSFLNRIYNPLEETLEARKTRKIFLKLKEKALQHENKA